MKQFGKIRGLHLTITLVLLVLHSCVSIKEAKNSKAIVENSLCFCNDSLKTQFNLNDGEVSLKPGRTDLKILKRLALRGRYCYLFKAGYRNTTRYRFYALHRDTEFDKKELKSYQKITLNDSLFYWMRMDSYKKKKSLNVLLNCKNQGIGIYFFPADSLMHDLEICLSCSVRPVVSGFRCGKSYTTCTATNPFDIAERTFTKTDSGNYLLPIFGLPRFKVNYKTDPEILSYRKALAGYYTLAGMPDSAKSVMKSEISDNKLGEGKQKWNVTALANLIADNARHHQILMINENPVRPESRYFGGLLLKKLYEAGYRYLAVEALKNDSINVRKFVSVSDGLYTREPTFANMLNAAAQLGFTLVSYDNPNKADREIKACEVLNEKVFKPAPQAKLVVWVSDAHIDERDRGDQSLLAYYFKRKLGKDPFTIDQTALSESSLADDQEVEFALRSTKDNRYRYNCDLYVSHNLNNLRNGNCFCDEKKKKITIQLPLPDKNYAVKEHYLLYVYADKNSVKNPVPAAIRYINPKIPQIDLTLCEGSYKVLLKNQFYETIYKNDLIVSMNN